MELHELYDEFQSEAVDCIENDFTEHPQGRFLLVIPTGGGKTRTCLKGIANLFKSNKFKLGEDKILWVAHRVELIQQAEKSCSAIGDQYELKNFSNSFYFVNNTKADEKMNASYEQVKLIVIDEAHRSAASTYKRLFDYSEKPILGLTATPSRHDGEPLPYERETYSIGFPDLIDKKILVKPEIIKEKGIELSINSLSSEDCLEKLNDEKRNKTIRQSIIDNHSKFKKIVIFLGTKKHVKEFYEFLKNSEVNDLYDGNIFYITGDSRSTGQERDDFIESQILLDRSIIINVDVLTEGYDDPKINTTIIARPTRSKLFYMQAAGRALRRDPNDPHKKSYIVEIEDELPNIRYRLDNRWLYAEISDCLEPVVIDATYSDDESLKQLEKDILENLEEGYLEKFLCKSLSLKNLPKKENGDLEVLLFKHKLQGSNKFSYFHLPLNDEHRKNYTYVFNSLSEQFAQPGRSGYVNLNTIMLPLRNHFKGFLAKKKHQDIIQDAMKNSLSEDTLYSEHKPWLSYLTIRKTDSMSNDMKEVELELKYLVLDPNNPRFTMDAEKVPLSETFFPDKQKETHDIMCEKGNHSDFDIPGLINSIVKNGFRPLDRIYVRSIPESEFFLVLEGNRRTTALKKIYSANADDPIFEGKSLDEIKELKDDIKKIKVCVLNPHLSEGEMRRIISQILGLRHHGSLKEWSPFAKAMSIYTKYMKKFGENNDFRWDPTIGTLIAQTLGIKPDDAKKSIRVFKAMEALQKELNFQEGAEIKSRYYSVINELINSSRDGLKEHIKFTSDTFKFSGDAIEKLDKLCFFSYPERHKGQQASPIKNPREWKPYNSILTDPVPEKKLINIKRVEEDGEHPSDVWAERSEEIATLEWQKFLNSAFNIISKVEFGSILDMKENEKAKAISVLNELLEDLEKLN